MIRILLAEDMHMVRGALAALLSLEPDLLVVAQVERGDCIVSTAERHRPDVAVIDVDLPGLDGIAASEELRERLPSCRTLILTSLDQPGTLRRAMAAGVGGYLLKDAPPSELAAGVRRVAAGHLAVAPELAMSAWESGGQQPLTPRETTVLRLAADGADVTQIAEQLHLSAGTVRNYLTSIVSKLHARNRLDAVRIARAAGWL
ncbi:MULTISPECIES: DNA-binding response regulator [unclassified Streptomyces]|uniref:response regulator transcription factor n=1 Tax=unclassified Streptomyces TaxID=2593676 RepID=UPI000939D973|nr:MULTISPECIES: response regulator transcription factor [unclassified Streptomyces]MCD2463390.1 response regulator transcription factor [Streptomyces sp. MBT42]OKJ62862.1 MerR family transcriptional regulator [Streptomyces sp. CB02009]